MQTIIMFCLVPLPSYIQMLFQRPGRWTLRKDLEFSVPPVSRMLSHNSRSLEKIRLLGLSRQTPTTQSGVLGGDSGLLNPLGELLPWG